MAWNEPGNNGKNNDPWNQGGRNQGPPDMDEVFRNLSKKLGGIFGGGGSGGLVCTGGVSPQGVVRSACSHAGVLWLGNRQDRVDGGAACSGTPAGAGLELDGLAGWHGDHNENVLGGTVGAVWCPKNRLIVTRELSDGRRSARSDCK